MKKQILIALFSLSAMISYAQCGCYSVQGIELTSDTVMSVTFKNTCDGNVYLQGWVFNNTNDTLAVYDCFCGAVLPFNQNATWDFRSKVSTMPSLGTLRVSISNGTLVCPAVTFDPVLSLRPEVELALRLYPNPIKDQLFWEGDINISAITIFSVLGEKVAHKWQPAKVIDLSSLQRGIYYAEIKTDAGAYLRKKIVLE